jgi:hypothetical protein
MVSEIKKNVAEAKLISCTGRSKIEYTSLYYSFTRGRCIKKLAVNFIVSPTDHNSLVENDIFYGRTSLKPLFH